MVTKLQAGVLPGDEQVRRLAKSGEGMGNGTELDGFRTRSYDERNAILAQLPPWLRRCGCRRSGGS
jgi:hypothetical protein